MVEHDEAELTDASRPDVSARFPREAPALA